MPTPDFIDLNTIPATGRLQNTSLSRPDIKRSTAYHEAGHAIVGTRGGMPLESLQLYEIDAGLARIGLTGSTTWVPSLVNGFDFAVECAAGPAAERRWHEQAGFAVDEHTGGDHDRQLATQVLARTGFQLVTSAPAPAGGATWNEVTEATERALDRLWPQITLVATALLAAPGQRLTGDQVSILTGYPNPTATLPPHGLLPSSWRTPAGDAGMHAPARPRLA